jgi:hydrogenase assembly chaperone HypC/HupF
MCLAIPARIISIRKNNMEGCASVEIMGVENEVNIQLIEQPRAGDFVLVHAGCAIQKISPEYFGYLSDFYEEWFKEHGS